MSPCEFTVVVEGHTVSTVTREHIASLLSKMENETGSSDEDQVICACIKTSNSELFSWIMDCCPSLRYEATENDMASVRLRELHREIHGQQFRVYKFVGPITNSWRNSIGNLVDRDDHLFSASFVRYLTQQMQKRMMRIDNLADPRTGSLGRALPPSTIGTSRHSLDSARETTLLRLKLLTCGIALLQTEQRLSIVDRGALKLPVYQEIYDKLLQTVKTVTEKWHLESVRLDEESRAKYPDLVFTLEADESETEAEDSFTSMESAAVYGKATSTSRQVQSAQSVHMFLGDKQKPRKHRLVDRYDEEDGSGLMLSDDLSNEADTGPRKKSRLEDAAMPSRR